MPGRTRNESAGGGGEIGLGATYPCCGRKTRPTRPADRGDISETARGALDRSAPLLWGQRRCGSDARGNRAPSPLASRRLLRGTRRAAARGPCPGCGTGSRARISARRIGLDALGRSRQPPQRGVALGVVAAGECSRRCDRRWPWRQGTPPWDPDASTPLSRCCRGDPVSRNPDNHPGTDDRGPSRSDLSGPGHRLSSRFAQGDSPGRRHRPANRR